MTNEIIYTKKDFKNAIVNKQDYIVVEGNLAKQLHRVSSIKKISAGKLRLVLGAIILGGGISTCVAGPAGATAVITAAAIKLSVDQACVIAIMMLSGTLSLSILISESECHSPSVAVQSTLIHSMSSRPSSEMTIGLNFLPFVLSSHF